jgi:TonB family protein
MWRRVSAPCGRGSLWTILLMVGAVSLRSQEILHSTQPTLIHKVEPQYTKEALEAKLQGAVNLSATVGADGVPTDITVVTGLGMGLDEKAVECLRQWRFRAATNHGEAVAAKVRVVIEFRVPPRSSQK